MEELKAFLGIIEEYGWPAALTAILVFDKVKLLWRKHVSKNYISYNIIAALQTEVSRINKTVQKISDSEMEKERDMEGIATKLRHLENRSDELGYLVRDISGSLKTNNRIMGEVKDYMERWGEKK